jgi:hypothetical protein
MYITFRRPVPASEKLPLRLAYVRTGFQLQVLNRLKAPGSMNITQALEASRILWKRGFFVPVYLLRACIAVVGSRMALPTWLLCFDSMVVPFGANKKLIGMRT